MQITDWLGWAATGVFVGSYLCRGADAIRRVQMIGAAMWIGYGILMQAAPVVVANVLVLAAAAWSSWRQAPEQEQG
jgi:hypothetical protein